MVAMIRFACGTCNERLSVPVKFAGRRGACPSCRAVNRVPAASEASEVAAQPGRVERVGAAGSSSAAAQGGFGVSIGTTVVERRDYSNDATPEPPAVRVTVRETVWRSIDPPTVGRPPAPAVPAPPAARTAPPAPPNKESPRTSPPAAWPEEDASASARPLTASPALPGAWPDDAAPARKHGGPLGWFTKWPAVNGDAHADADALVTLQREWSVDRGGLPMPAKLALLVLCVLAFGLIVWGTIYGLLGLLVSMDQ